MNILSYLVFVCIIQSWTLLCVRILDGRLDMVYKLQHVLITTPALCSGQVAAVPFCYCTGDLFSVRSCLSVFISVLHHKATSSPQKGIQNIIRLILNVSQATDDCARNAVFMKQPTSTRCSIVQPQPGIQLFHV